MTTKFEQKDYWGMHRIMLRSKVMQGSIGVKEVNLSTTDIWPPNSSNRTIVVTIELRRVVKGHAEVIWGQLEVKLSSNAIWPPNLSKRTTDVSIELGWGQRSCRGHLGSMRSICLAQTYDHQIWVQQIRCYVHQGCSEVGSCLRFK